MDSLIQDSKYLFTDKKIFIASIHSIISYFPLNNYVPIVTQTHLEWITLALDLDFLRSAGSALSFLRNVN